jgi:hypothetical protein
MGCPQYWWQTFWGTLGTGVLSSVLAAIVAGVCAYLKVKTTLSERVELALDASRLAKEMKQSLDGAKLMIAGTQKTFISKMMEHNVPAEVTQWFISDIKNVEFPIDTCSGKIENLIGSLDTLSRLGRKKQ